MTGLQNAGHIGFDKNLLVMHGREFHCQHEMALPFDETETLHSHSWHDPGHRYAEDTFSKRWCRSSKSGCIGYHPF